MNKLFLSLLCITLLITSASATTLTNRELKQSQYGSLGDILGVGDRIYKNTYSDGTIEYEYARGISLKPAFITSLQTTVVTNKFVDVPITLRGISCMFGDAVNTHILASTNANTGTYLGEQDYEVPCNTDYNGQFTIQIVAQPAQIKIQEYIKLKGTLVRGDSRTISVTYPGSTPTSTPYYPTPFPTVITSPPPIQTTIPTQYQCSNGDWVSSPSLCPVIIPTTPVPTETSVMILSTPVPIATQPPVEYQCPDGSWVYDPTDCPQSTPGFEAIFAIVGLFITAGLILRHRKK